MSGRGAVSERVADCRYYTQQGIAASDRGDGAEAELLLSKAVASCPIDVDARRHYGEALWQRGAWHEAVTQIEHAIQLSRHDPALPARAGEMYLALGELTKAGRKVAKGAPLMILEAMKMEHTIAAPANGTVEAVHYRVGDQVEEGVELIAFAADEPA